MVPAVTAGFLLTALQRWTRTAPISRSCRNAVAAFWCAGRLAHAVIPEAASVASAGFIVSPAVFLAWRAIAVRATREYKIVVLLLLLASASLLAAVIAGRIVPALSDANLLARGGRPGPTLPVPLERAAALSLAAALAIWSFNGDVDWRAVHSLPRFRSSACCGGDHGAPPAISGCSPSMSPMAGFRSASRCRNSKNIA